MNNTIASPQGLSYEVQRIQKDLYDELVALWPQGLQLDGYGMVFKNEVEGGHVEPQAFVKGTGNSISGDYTLNLVEEKNKFFFSKESKSVRNEFDSYTAKVALYFIVNLKSIKPAVEHRAVDEVQGDVMRILHTLGIDDIVGIVDTELDVIVKEFRKLYSKVKEIDMHPLHIFRIDTQIMFNYNKKC